MQAIPELFPSKIREEQSLELIDIGCNLTHESFQHDLDEVLERARAAGVAQLVVTGASERESLAAQALATRYPQVMYATAGVHPHHAQEWTEDTLRSLEELAKHPEVVAIGEVGLDFNRDFSPRSAQEIAFEAQLDLATALDLPVFMHERDAHERFLAILSRYRDRLGAAVIHCFTGNQDQLAAYLELDLYVGVTGWICDERRGHHLRDIVSTIPANRLMLETDSPYLLPRDLRPKPKSRRNEPMHLRHILGVVAQCRGVTAEALASASTENARRFFRLRAGGS